MSILSSSYSTGECTTVELVDGALPESWDRVRNATKGLLTDWGVNLLRSGLDGFAKSVFVESAYVCKDYRNLFSHFYSKKFRLRASECSRIHFFSKEGLSVEDVVFRPTSCQDAYIGFSVIEPVVRSCIGRTVVDPRKLGKPADTHFCLRTSSKVRIQGTDYTVKGFPYRSQSGEAIVCAHTALWSACRYLSERYPAYGELYPYDLIEMTGDTNGRRVPYRGMTYSDYSTILSGFGCHPAIIRPRTGSKTDPKSWDKDPDAFYDLYAYMESGFPVLTSFDGHVVNIIGHTISDKPQPKHTANNAGYYNSVAFLKEFVVVDDNFFPYQLLAYDGQTQYYGRDGYARMAQRPSIDSIYAAVVPLPEKTYLRPSDARRKAYRFLEHSDISSLVAEMLKELGGFGQHLIARQFVTSASVFKSRKRDFFEKNPTDSLLSFPISLNLPHFVWITEVSFLDLFNQRQCIGEVVVDATIGPHEWEPIYARIGRYLIVGTDKQRDSVSPACYPQYTHNLGRI